MLKEFDQLRVTVDDKLNWSRHIEKLYKKLSSAQFSIKQIKFLPKSSLVTTYRSLVESRLHYCNVVWGNCGSPLTEKLQRLQNRAIQLISKESESADCNKSFTDLLILNIQQLIAFNATNMVYDSVNENCPEYLTDIFIPAQKIHNYSTRHANHGLFPSHTNLAAGQRTFQYRECHLCNSLPQQIQCATTSQNF